MHADSDTARHLRQIRANYNNESVVVYQAFPPEIAEPAVAHQRFVAPFKMTRMTWVKPSFLWMMYRSGWASKPGQERILAVHLTRRGFESALRQGCLSTFDAAVHGDRDHWESQLRQSRVRVQWDPDRDLALKPLPQSAIQIGLAKAAAMAYVLDWTTHIVDITDKVKAVHRLVLDGDLGTAKSLLPIESAYPVTADVQNSLGMP